MSTFILSLNNEASLRAENIGQKTFSQSASILMTSHLRLSVPPSINHSAILGRPQAGFHLQLLLQSHFLRYFGEITFSYSLQDS
ncbi:hypothetical protein J6590_058948 [Homalodisca vitripennis]|nr:hypothetical protein J6590_058948 [Homalodisca vitripennis]